MRLRRPTIRNWFRNSKVTLLLWATLIGVLFGVLGLGEPVEDKLRALRNTIRAHDSNGEIVVIGIDDNSIEKEGRWPWPRAKIAKMIDNLNAAGAKQIYFDLRFNGRTDEVNDHAFYQSIARSKRPVIVAEPVMFDATSREFIPAAAGSNIQNTESVFIGARWNYAREIWRLPSGYRAHGAFVKSLSAHLANVRLPEYVEYPVDYAVKWKSVRTISGSTVVGNDPSLKMVAGKKVVIGLTSQLLNDIYVIAGQGQVPGVYISVIGSETLHRGIPVSLGWLTVLLCTFILISVAIFGKNKWVSRGLLVMATVTIMFFPLILERNLIFADIVPSLMMIFSVSVSLFWRRVRRKGETTDQVSGLPNLNALRDSLMASDSNLVIARIHNYADIISSLLPEMKSTLIGQIVSRFTLGTGGAALYQGDEGVFAWLAPKAASRDLGDEIDGLYALLAAPVSVGYRQIDLGVTFGIESDGTRPLANRIGSAMVAADEARKSGARWQNFDVESLATANWRQSLLGRIDGAIDDGEMWVAYQAKLDIATGAITGAEALIRWEHPERGVVNPDDFIVVAEESGRIERLTMYVLRDATRAAVAINRSGVPFGIAVNLSATLLDNPYLGDSIQNVLREYGLPPERLTFEVTETMAIKGSRNSTVLLDDLRRANIGVSVDDYGTGYSTLDYFKKIPATEIKIDKSFVSRIEHSTADRLMVASTITLAHQLGRKTVAEGVETEGTLRVLREMGCHSAQGFLIGRPQRFVSFARALARERLKRAA